MKYILPTSLIFSIFLFVFPIVFKSKEINKRYTQPSFGTDSDNINYISKVGDIEKNSKILFFGDSNALALKIFFDYIGKQNHFAVNTFSISTYLPLKGLDLKESDDDTINKDHVVTRKYMEKAIEFSKFLDPYIRKSDVIIINCTKYDRVPSQLNSIINLANNLKNNQKLIILNTFPVLDKNPIRINQGIIKKSAYNFKLEYKEIPQNLLDIIKSKKNVFLYDINKSKILKNPPYFNDTIIFYDKGHLNNYGAKLLAQDLEKDFMNFWNLNIK